MEFESVIKNKTVNIVIVMSITFFLKIIYFLKAIFSLKKEKLLSSQHSSFSK
jgi:hypothetical protein